MIRRTLSILTLIAAGCIPSFPTSVYDVFGKLADSTPEAVVIRGVESQFAEMDMPFVYSADIIAVENADSALMNRWFKTAQDLPDENKIVEVNTEEATVCGWSDGKPLPSDTVGVLMLVSDGESGVALLVKGSSEMLSHLVNSSSSSIISF